MNPAAQRQREQPAPPARPACAPTRAEPASDHDEDIDAEIAARDGGEAFPTLPIGPGTAPARQPRLRLRQLTEDEQEAAASALQTMAEELACKIEDADSWTSGDGYISAIPAAQPHPRPTLQQQQQRQRPPRVTRTQREHRLDEALDEMAAVQQERPTSRSAVRRARRRVGRIRASMRQQQLRHDFARNESKCVEDILRAASAETAAEEHPETCPIDSGTLHEHFTAVNSPRINFLPDEACGALFREAMADVGTPQERRSALTDELTVDEVEDQLMQAATNSSPGHDGVGYDIYKKFAAQL
ncbi:hypothetical protein PHYSODRAFT_334484, partial [Phytophthora sojae]